MTAVWSSWILRGGLTSAIFQNKKSLYFHNSTLLIPPTKKKQKAGVNVNKEQNILALSENTKRHAGPRQLTLTYVIY